MFSQKVSDPAEEATEAEATAVVEVIQDQPEAARRHQGITAVRHAQAPAEAIAVVPLEHHDRVQHGQAAQYGKNRML